MYVACGLNTEIRKQIRVFSFEDHLLWNWKPVKGMIDLFTKVSQIYGCFFPRDLETSHFIKGARS